MLEADHLDAGHSNPPFLVAAIGPTHEDPEYVSPRTCLEVTLAEILRAVLNLEKVGIWDNFFELGGDSIQATALVHQLQTVWQEYIHPTAIFDAPTIAELAAYLCLNHRDRMQAIYGSAVLEEYEAEFKIAGILHQLEQLSEAEAEKSAQSNVNQNMPGDEAASQSHNHFMRLAISAARDAIHAGQPPYAACIVKNGELISCVHNVIWQNQDITAHAEVQAIREACRKLKTTHLSGCILYSTCEPCSMCLTACHWAKIDRIFYGLSMEDEIRTGLSTITIPAATMNEMGGFHLSIKGGLLRDEMLDVVEYFLNSKIENRTDYNQIAKQYEKTKDSLVRKHIESFTLLNKIGAVANQSILDLGCGEGHYGRIFKGNGAKRVVGLDISSAMIQIARQKELQESLGIEFKVCNLLDFQESEKFDIAVSVNVLHYARTREELRKMCQTIYDSLEVNGHLFAIVESTTQDISLYANYKKYGIIKSIQTPIQDGSKVSYTMYNGSEYFNIACYYYSQTTWDNVLSSVGFREVTWWPMQLAPEALMQCGEDYWQDFLKAPPVIGLTCRK